MLCCRITQCDKHLGYATTISDNTICAVSPKEPEARAVTFALTGTHIGIFAEKLCHCKFNIRWWNFDYWKLLTLVVCLRFFLNTEIKFLPKSNAAKHFWFCFLFQNFFVIRKWSSYLGPMPQNIFDLQIMFLCIKRVYIQHKSLQPNVMLANSELPIIDTCAMYY